MSAVDTDILLASPLSQEQLRLWRLLAACPAQSFRSYGVVEVDTDMSLGELRQAFEVVSQRHELLRLQPAAVPGLVYPVLEEVPTCPVEYHEMGTLHGNETDAIEAIARELAACELLNAQRPIRVCFGTLAQGGTLWGLALPAYLGDGPSVDAILVDVSRAVVNARNPQPGGARSSYRNISHWREQVLAAPEAQPGRGFWEAQLQAPQSLSRDTIVLDERHLRPGDGVDIGTLTARWPGEIESSRALAAWYWLLWKLCDCPKSGLHIGTHFDGRSTAREREAIGPLERFLPISVPIDAGQRFGAVCEALAAQLDRASEWQDCFSWSHFDDLEDEGGPIRSYDYCFESVASPRPLVERQGLSLKCRFSRSESYRLKLDIVRVSAYEAGITLHYDSAHFPPSHARQLLHTYRGVLEQVARDPDIRLRELTWGYPELPDAPVTAQSGHQQEECESVVERFWRTAATHPDRIALTDDRHCLSYACLAARTQSLARTIRNRAPQPDSCVAVVGAISFNTVLALLAVLGAGRCFVHVDPDYPPARVRKMLRECHCQLILYAGCGMADSSRRLAEALGIAPQQIVTVDGGTLADGTPVVSANVHAAQLAYAIYTSGSTGDPNGVLISQGSLARQIDWLLHSFDFSAQDTWLLKTPLGFDASVWEWLTPLCLGARLALAGPGLHLQPGRMAACIAAHRVTVLQVVPNQLRAVLSEAEPRQLRSLRLLFVGGEELPADLCWMVREHSDTALINLYGPTETTINATWWAAPARFARTDATSIGWPVAGMQALVLDPHGQKLPPGFMGELYLLGSGLARGYAGKAPLTAEKFLPAPVGVGQRMYRTGDRVCRTQDGALRFLGRLDKQIKLRGYRIELGELEAVLCAHSGVRTAIACIWAATGSTAESRLVAYAVARDAASRPAVEELRAHLRAQLPEYMVPASIIVLDTLPLTVTGKVNRKLLASPEFIGLHRAGTPEPAQTRTQRVLCDIWRQILQVEVVGINDDFLQLGGQSLLVTRLVAHVRSTLGIDLSPRVVFDFPVLRQLAEYIDGVT